MLYPTEYLPIAVDHSVDAIHTVRWAGVNPADGRPMWYDKNGNVTYFPTVEDRVFIGDGQAEIIGGFGNTFRYKGLSLNIFFQASLGKTVIPSTIFVFGIAQVGATITNGLEESLTESWHNPGDLVSIAAPQVGSPTYPGTDFYDTRTSNAFFDASYIRLKNASLSYRLPNSVTDALNIRGLQFYISGYNLVTWTSFPGNDPEVSGVFDASSYPAVQRFNGGIKIQF